MQPKTILYVNHYNGGLFDRSANGGKSMTVGDVQAIIAFIAALGATLWAAILVCALLFAGQARRAEYALVAKSGKTVGIGVGVLAPGVLLALVLAQAGGVGQLVGWFIALMLAALACVGSSGLASIVATKIQQNSDDKITRFGAITRAAGFLVAAGFTPIIGWFFIYPLALTASVGAGVAGVFGKDPLPAANAFSVPAAPYDLN